MKKTYQIWNDGLDMGKLIPVEDIEESIGCFDFDLYKIRDPRITADNAADAIAALNDDFAGSEYTDVRDFLDSNGIAYEYCSERYVSADDFLVGYNTIDKRFCDNAYDTVSVYTWWDGSNFAQEERPEDYIEVDYDPDAEVCLDTWNGSNYQSGGVGLHSYYAVLDDGRYLMVYRSQWQGDHTMAEIISEINFGYVAGKNYLA